jgi:TolB protein
MVGCDGARRTFIATLVLVVTTGLAAQPASATFPGLNGRIVFQSDGLSTIKLDGTGLVPLTANGGDAAPEWSPDGGRIAFERSAVIHVINSDGTGLRSLAVGGGHPTWSPEGAHIAFDTNGSGISVINADGTGYTDLTDANDAFPEWSPDGSRIAFARWDGSSWAIWVMEADGENAVMLFDGPANDVAPEWSPDGSQLVFASTTSGGQQVFRMDADGSNPVQLTSTGENDSAVFSPDGTLIAFMHVSGGTTAFWTMNVDGSNQVLRRANVAMSQPDWQPVQLTLSASKGKVPYKGVVVLTAHLVDLGTTNQTVSIYARPHDQTATLIGSGSVDAAGNLSMSVRVPKRTAFFATWSGDTDHPAGGTSNSLTVLASAQLRARLSGHYASSGRYRLYHFTSACPRRVRRCPTYTASIAPNHASMRLSFTLQLQVAGRWRTALSFSDRIPLTNRIVERFVYRNETVINVPVRVRTTFKGDVDHLSTRTPWAYFKVKP